MATTILDANQVIKRVYDEATERLRVDANVSATVGTAEVVISHVDDSIRLGDGVDLVTATTVGSDVGLDVNVIGGVVSGTFTPTGLSTDIKTQAINVTSTATKIPTTSLVGRNAISVRVWGTNTVYFGDNTVTVANGYPKMQNEEIILEIRDGAAVDLYGICDTGLSCEVRVMELA